MPKPVVSIPVLLCAFILLIGLWAGTDKNTLSSWIQIIGIFAGYFYICGFISTPGERRSFWLLARLLLISGLVILIWLSQNRIVAIYLIGCVYLGSYFISSHAATRERHAAFQSPLQSTVIIGGLIALVLLASPLTVSRIVVSLANLPVPSKFELHSDPGARQSHYASIGFPSHSLNPIIVVLNANNVQLDEPMPLLTLTARRETNFIFEQIQYDFLHTTLYRLKFDGLHQVKLSKDSDDVTLSKASNGIVIEDITGGETAWLKLPDIDGTRLRSGAALKSSGIKIILWIAICCAFLLWAPHRTWKTP
jgi:hypothetical protein